MGFVTGLAQCTECEYNWGDRRRDDFAVVILTCYLVHLVTLLLLDRLRKSIHGLRRFILIDYEK